MDKENIYNGILVAIKNENPSISDNRNGPWVHIGRQRKWETERQTLYDIACGIEKLQLKKVTVVVTKDGEWMVGESGVDDLKVQTSRHRLSPSLGCNGWHEDWMQHCCVDMWASLRGVCPLSVSSERDPCFIHFSSMFLSPLPFVLSCVYMRWSTLTEVLW